MTGQLNNRLKSKKYPFLQLITEQEGIARGINLSDKSKYLLYKSIKKVTTAKNAREGNLFRIDSEMEGYDRPMEDKIIIIKQLIGEEMVSELVFLDYIHLQGLKLTPVFVANNEESSEFTNTIYNVLVEKSYDAIERMLKGRDSITEDQLLADLRYDLDQMEKPKPQNLNYTVFDIAGVLTKTNYPVPPHNDLLRFFYSDLKSELLDTSLAIELPGMGFMPFLQSERLLRFDTAATFIKRKVIPRYNNNKALQKSLNEIDIAETSYYVDEFARDNAEFDIQRAAAIRYAQGRAWFSGWLGVNIVLQMEGVIHEEYEKKWEEKNAEAYSKFKEDIIMGQSSGYAGVIYLTEKEKIHIHPEIWKRLDQDKQIYIGHWETYQNSRYILLYSVRDAVINLISRLNQSPPRETWKIISVKTAIEEQKNLFQQLNTSIEFTRLYDKVITPALIEYMPWFYRILFMLGISLFKDRAYHRASINLMQEQDQLIRSNRTKNMELQESLNREKEQRRNSVGLLSLQRKIVEKLDEMYFEDHQIPTAKELIDSMGLDDPSIAYEILEKEKFQNIALNKEDSYENHIIIHPLDHEWRVKSTHLYRSLETIFQNELNDPASENLKNRARAVQKLITNLQKTKSVDLNTEVDPYKKLESAIQKYK